MILLAHAALLKRNCPISLSWCTSAFLRRGMFEKAAPSGDKCDEACNAAPGPHRLAGRFARANRERPRQGRRGIARRDDQRGLGHRRASGRGLRRHRADGRAALCVRHAPRPDRLGRRPSGLSAQDPDRPARPYPDATPGRRLERFHQALGKRIRRVRSGPFLDLDLGQPRHGGRRAISRIEPTMSWR